MPLYFVLSGLFFKDYGGFRPTIIKKANKLIIPFLFFYLSANILIWINYTLKSTPEAGRQYHILDLFFADSFFNNPIWFLLCLFWDNIIFLGIFKIAKSTIARGVLALIAGLAGYTMATLDIILPLHLTTALSSIPYFFFGYMLKRTPLLYPNAFRKYELPAALMLLVIGIGLSSIFDQPYYSFYNNTPNGNLLLIYITAAAMVTGALLLCKQIGHIPVVSYIGRYSIIPLGIHAVFIHYVAKFPVAIGMPYPTAVTFAITIVLSLACIPIMKRYLPYVTAQKDLLTDRQICAIGR